MKLRYLLPLFLCCAAFGQALVRFGPYEFPSVSSTSPPFLVANLSPNLPTLSVCASPANQVPCTNYQTTFQFNGTACPNGSQDTPDPNATTSACQSTGDAQGNIGFWAPPGQYDITICISNNCFLYTVTNNGNGSVATSLILANASSPGTTLYTLTKLTGSPSTATIAATTDTGGVVGIVTAGAGTTGNATIQTSGLVNCVFSNATTADDYVQISSTTGGDCKDIGSTYPSTAQIIGRVLSTNGSSGTYQIYLFPPEIQGGISGVGTNGYYTGWSGLYALGNAPASYSGLNSTFNGSIATASDGVHAGAVQLIGNPTAPTLPANSFSILGPNSASFTAFGWMPPAAENSSPGLVHIGAAASHISAMTVSGVAIGDHTATGTPSSMTFLRGDNTWAVPTGGITPPSNPQIGDTLRYNVYGDSAWDAAPFAGPTVTIFTDYANGGTSVYGAYVENFTALYTGGSSSTQAPTASVGAGVKLTSSTSASSSTVIGGEQGRGANFGTYSFGSWYRWTLKFAAGNTTSVRYWMGLTVYSTGASGCATGSPVGSGGTGAGSSCYAANTPNVSLVGFRYSAGTDTHWQAVSQNAGTQTLTDTGVTPDTNPHYFEVAGTGSSFVYLIDGVVKATITTNNPPLSSAGNNQVEMFWAGDNENTATAISGTQYWMTLVLK